MSKSYLKGLNPEQLEAVQCLDGPVMVVAGPGTGKTQLLSARAAHILHETDAGPQNLLCLTYTNEAAHNMRKRLIELIGPHADQITVKTFHSFAADIMANYRDYFFNAARMESAPDFIQTQAVESILEKLPLKHPLALKFAGQFTLTKDVLAALGRAKEAGLTPDKLAALLKLNLAYIDSIEPDLAAAVPDRISKNNTDELKSAVEQLPDLDGSAYLPYRPLSDAIKSSFAIAYDQAEETGKTTPISEWKRRFVQREDGQLGLHRERRANEWWLGLAEVYGLYRDYMHSHGYFDYSDMLIEVIGALESKPDLRADVQERFSYVMIDEFQDTNDAQLRLAHLVADHFLDDGKPNLMVVGDDDQSIFKFQGADINNMLDFEKSYPGATKIVLKTNYRSAQAVIDAADKIITQADYRLVTIDNSLTKQLTAADPKLQGEVVRYEYPSQEHQLAAVAKQIAGSVKTNPDAAIAVIARKHASLERVAAYLQQQNVPVRYERKRNILLLEPIQTIIQILSCIQTLRAGRNADALLSLLLRHPMFGLKPKDYVALAGRARQPRSWLSQLEKSASQSAKSAYDWLAGLVASGGDNANLLVDNIIGLQDKSPLKDYYWPEGDISYRYLETLSAIQLLRQHVSQVAISGPPTLDELLKYIQLHLENNIAIADETVFTTGGQAVHLLTAYGAKGLEFDEVHIIDVIDREWSPNNRNRINTPSNINLRHSGEERDDYIRLLFVAMTRAKTRLNLHAYTHGADGEEVLPSVYLAALPQPQTLKADDPTLSEQIEVLSRALPSIELDSADSRPLLQARLRDYRLSVTHLINYLDVTNGGPRTFLERNLLRLPSIKTPQQSFGTAVHAALMHAQHLVNTDGKLSADALTATLRQALEAEIDDPQTLKRYAEQGEDVLERLLSLDSFKLTPGGQAERKIDYVQINEAVIRGTLDRVDVGADRVLITDYKTGKPLNKLNSQAKGIDGLKAWRHRTQLTFYALIAQHSDLKREIIETQMTYVEAKSDRELNRGMTPSDDEINQLQQMIELVWQKIQNLEFPDTDHYPQDYSGVLKFIADLQSGS